MSAFFVAAELVLVRVRAVRLEHWAFPKGFWARSVQKVLRRPDAALAVARWGWVLTTLGLGWMGGLLLQEGLALGLGGFGVEPYGFLWGFAFALAFMVVASFYWLLGEVLPQSLALRSPREAALWTLAPLWPFYRLFAPALRFFHATSQAGLSFLGLPLAGMRELGRAREELRVDFHLTVAQIMRPRQDIAFLSLQKSWEENLWVIRHTGHTRYPLCEGDIDHAIGIIHIKDIFLRRTPLQSSAELLQIKRELLWIPETRPVELLLQDFQQRRLHMAVVVDEYGTVVGLVTMKDILEELVGEIQDEFDKEPPKLQRTDEGYLVDGLMPVEEVARELDLPLETTSVYTLGGYVHSQLERIARVGDRVTLGPYEVRVVEMRGQRVTRLLLRLVEKPSALTDFEAPSVSVARVSAGPKGRS